MWFMALKGWGDSRVSAKLGAASTFERNSPTANAEVAHVLEPSLLNETLAELVLLDRLVSSGRSDGSEEEVAKAFATPIEPLELGVVGDTLHGGSIEG